MKDYMGRTSAAGRRARFVAASLLPDTEDSSDSDLLEGKKTVIPRFDAYIHSPGLLMLCNEVCRRLTC